MSSTITPKVEEIENDFVNITTTPTGETTPNAVTPTTGETTTTTEEETHPIQLIDGKGQFIEQEELQRYLKQTGLLTKGLDYSMVAVLGPQSSGKSTLLNLLFGTHFNTMDFKRGRYQVTLGIVFSKAQNADIAVMDLEGTDGKERGEEDATFERKTSLFALAIAEVLIVNMWHQDIGRYHAANFALLKIVFELNLQLFAKKSNSSKTLLMFVIRDYVAETTPLDILEQQLLSDVKKIWQSCTKPEEFANSEVTEFFDIDFRGLPHKIYQTDKFYAECEKFKHQFVDPNSEKYVFKPKYKKSVPIDGFQHYANSIWQVISQNKDLDIPTQKEMLAMFRCSEIAKESMEPFEEIIKKEWSPSIAEGKAIPKLGEQGKALVDKIIQNYLIHTEFYMPKVVELHKNELEDKMKIILHQLFDKQTLIYKTKNSSAFNTLLSKMVKSKIDQDFLLDFSNKIRKFRQDVEGAFEADVKSAMYPGEDWEYNVAKDQFKTEIDTAIETARRAELDVLYGTKSIALIHAIDNVITPLLMSPPHSFWKDMRRDVSQCLEQNWTQFETQLQGFDPTAEEKQTFKERLFEVGHERVLQKVKDNAQDQVLSLKMEKRFDSDFETQAIRVRGWRNPNEIKTQYERARKASLQLLDTFFLNRLHDARLDDVHLITTSTATAEGDEVTIFKYPKLSAEDEKQEIIGENTASRVFELFEARIENKSRDAERTYILQRKNEKIPWWIIIVIIVLGFNEIMYIISSPILLIGLIVIGIFFGLNMIETMIEEYLRENPMYRVIATQILTYLPPTILPNVRLMLAGVESNNNSSNNNSTTSTANTNASSSTPTTSSSHTTFEESKKDK